MSDSTSSGSVSPACTRMESIRKHVSLKEAEHKLMKMCLIPSHDNKARIFNILAKLRAKSSSAESLVSKFADRCYEGQVQDPMGQANAFIKQAFRTSKALYTLGPKDAFHYNVCRLAVHMQKSSEKPDENPKMYHTVCSGRYQVKKKLGSGGTANVHLAVDLKTKK